MNPDTHNPVPALRALATHGISKSSATFLQSNFWQLPANHLHIFDCYYLLHWDRAYFQDHMIEGTVTRQGITYQVIYHRTNPAEINKHKGDVLLSFRKLKYEYEVQPVVLVSIDKRK